jgi:hypothetical protein
VHKAVTHTVTRAILRFTRASEHLHLPAYMIRLITQLQMFGVKKIVCIIHMLLLSHEMGRHDLNPILYTAMYSI